MPRGSPTDAELIAALAALEAADGNQALAARSLVIPRRTLQGRVDHARRKGLSTGSVPKPAAPPPPPVDPAAKERERAKSKAERDEFVSAAKEVAFRQVLVDAIKESVPPMPRLAAPKPKKQSKATEWHPLLNLNDWHFEERVRSEGVLGLNEYDIDICCSRVHRVVKSLIHWKHNFEAGGRFTLPTITVALLGDMMTGTLHGLERHSSATNVVRAAIACGDLIALAIADLAREFETVKVVGVVGNHGRLPDDRKVPTKDPTRSWDYLAYQIALRRLTNQPNVSFDFPGSYGVLFPVAGHLCYAAHGNFIPNNLGIVGYGVRRYMSSLAGALQAVNKPLKFGFFGHWHQSSSAEFGGMQTFICPSLIGTQEYSFLNQGSVNKPAQDCFLFDKDLGLVGRLPFYGEGQEYDGVYEVAA